MADQFRPGGRPVQQDRTGPVMPTVVARQGDYLAALPKGDPELHGLLTGLAAINPRIEELQRRQDAEVEQQAHIEQKARAQLEEAPREVLSGAPIEPPTTVPPAFAESSRRVYVEALAQRAAVKIKGDAAQEYESVKSEPGFNPLAWLDGVRKRALDGVSDPVAQATIGAHLNELESSMRGEIERDRRDRVARATDEAVASMSADLFTANKTPQAIFQDYQTSFVPRLLEMGKTRKEAAQYLLFQLQAQSSALGGSPELFDVFSQKDSQGKTLADYNPQLGAAAGHARLQAVQVRDKDLLDKAEQSNAKLLMAYESDIDTAPEKVTPDRLIGDMTKYGAIQTPEKAASLYARAQEKLLKKLAAEQLDGQWGALFRLEPGLQNKVMDRRLSPFMDQLLKASQAGDAQQVAQVGAQIVSMQSASGSTIPWDQMKGWVTTLVSNVPSKDGPSPGFNAAVELYKAMGTAPQFRDMYFSEDTQKVLEAYRSAVGSGSDPRAAYSAAYASISPEAKAAADAFAKSPEGQKLAQKEAAKWVEGSSFWPRVLGGNGRPANGEVVGRALSLEMRNWRAANPYATDDQAEARAKSWVGKNFVLDTNSHMAIKVPAGLSGPATQEALSEFSKETYKRLQLGSRKDGDWSVQYVPVGQEGQMTVLAFNGSAVQQVGTIRLQDLLAANASRKVLSDEEAQAVGRLKAGLARDEPMAVELKVLAKAEALGAMKLEEVRQVRDRWTKSFLDRVNSTPRVDLGAPSADQLQNIPGRAGRTDATLTGRAALELMTAPMTAMGTQHQALAASLVTLGEGVALQAYDDPGKGAGRNIGMGYNLKANAETAKADLRRAGVPDERIDDVLAGRASLVPEQAKRLLMVSLPRYDKQVQEVANASTPGLWDRMTPAQKAVMVDVAYQTGNPDQFKKAWAALAAGNMEEFRKETKVFYTSQAGDRVEDTRRGQLRASMLAGIPHWEATVQKYGALPSSRIEALSHRATR